MTDSRFRRTILRLFVMTCLSLVAPVAVAGPSAVKVKSVSCVWVANHLVLPLKGLRYGDDQGHVRCEAALVAGAKDPGELAVSLEIRQDGKTLGKANTTFHLWPSARAGVELEAQPSEDLNGCMPFEISMTVAGTTKSVTAEPSCSD